MSATPRSPETRLDLALPGAQRPVQAWVTAPANSPDRPSIGRSWSATPQVIYAEHRPRLSGPELLARHRGDGATTAPVQRSCPVASRAPNCAVPGGRVNQLRPAWWGVLVVAAVVLSAGVPLI